MVDNGVRRVFRRGNHGRGHIFRSGTRTWCGRDIDRRWTRSTMPISGLCLTCVGAAVASKRHFLLRYWCEPGAARRGLVVLMDRPIYTNPDSRLFDRRDVWRSLAEQKYQCALCLCDLTKESAVGDHIQPFVRGGPTTPDNLQAVCDSCNRAKGARTTAEWRAAQ